MAAGRRYEIRADSIPVLRARVQFQDLGGLVLAGRCQALLAWARYQALFWDLARGERQGDAFRIRLSRKAISAIDFSLVTAEGQVVETQELLINDERHRSPGRGILFRAVLPNQAAFKRAMRQSA
jgi:hypothetical protein